MSAPLDPVSISYKIQMESERFGNATLGRIETKLTTTDSGYQIDSVTKFQGMATIISGSNLREQCEFKLEEGRAITHRYEGGRIKAFDYKVGFDWENRKIDYNSQESVNMPIGYVVDNCSMWFAMALTRGEGLKDELVYVVDGKKRRVRGFKFRSLEDEVIDTVVGQKPVLKLVLERELRSDRTITFWLSKEDQYIPLRMQEKRKSRTTTFSVNSMEKLN